MASNTPCGPEMESKCKAISQWNQDTMATLFVSYLLFLSRFHHMVKKFQLQPMVVMYLPSAFGLFPIWPTVFLSFCISSFDSSLHSFLSICWSPPATTPLPATLCQHSCSQATFRKRIKWRWQHLQVQNSSNRFGCKKCSWDVCQKMYGHNLNQSLVGQQGLADVLLQVGEGSFNHSKSPCLSKWKGSVHCWQSWTRHARGNVLELECKGSGALGLAFTSGWAGFLQLLLCLQ